MTTKSGHEIAKRTLIEGLHAARQAVIDALAGVPLDQFDQPSIDDWSILDLLAHLVGWDFTYLKAIPEMQEGQLPAFYGYWDKDWQSYNALIINLYKQGDPAEQVASLQDSYARLVELLETLPAAELPLDRGLAFKGEPVTIDRLLKAQIEDERVHAAQIRDFAARLTR